MKLKKRNKASAVFNMASLTDIIFLLLIFFVINSEMPNALKLILPNASGKTPASKSITVALSNDLTYMVNSQVVEYEAVKIALQGEISKSNSDEPTVVLKIDKDVSLEKAVELLDIGNQLKVPMILATKPK
ncbi:MAG: biopolymer transporter ExbD [Chitinophagales bacterium]|jgi:biopolymer transport protein ExbD|tara:strand:- start:15 stop:407 length:393 start_codon:yes stop_codon:yes gene_type:complete